MTKEKREYVLLPFVCAIDSREQFPVTFRGLTADADKGKLPLVVPVETRTLKTGDYSIVSLEDEVCIERKSLADLYSTLCEGRERFIRELERMQEFKYSAIVCEADWNTIINSPPNHTKFSPKSVYRSILSWSVRFPKTHFWPCYSRAFAEHTTLRLLEKYWKHREKSMPNSIDT